MEAKCFFIAGELVKRGNNSAITGLGLLTFRREGVIFELQGTNHFFFFHFLADRRSFPFCIIDLLGLTSSKG